VNEVTTANESAPLPVGPPFKDRSKSLLVFGILEILMGLLCVLLVGIMVLAQMIASRTTDSAFSGRMLLPAVVVYMIMAVVFLWLGVGSIKCRRWARALLLILAWSWLCVGVLSLAAMTIVLPRILAAAPTKGQPLPSGALAVIVAVQLVIIGVFLVAVPAVLVFFYGSRHVKATCESRDTARRWTDACPLPVLAVACWLWFGGATMLSLPFAYNGVMPLFGTLVSGPTGVIVVIALAAVWLWLGVMWYQIKVAGWWGLAVAIALLGLSSYITFSRLDMLEMYQKMGYPAAQIDLIRKQGLTSNQFVLWISTAWLPLLLGYMLWVKRLFRPVQKA